MPSGLKRFQKAEALHFITFSCYQRLPFLQAPAPKETFEAVLEETRIRHQARIYAYVLMPEHVHLLINEPPSILVAQFLKALKQITSRKLRGNRSQFWQPRYFDVNIYGYSGSSVTVSRSRGRQVDFSLRKIHRALRLETATTTEEPLKSGRSEVIRYIHPR